MELKHEIHSINGMKIADDKAREDIEKIWQALRSLNVPDEVEENKND